MLPKAFRMRSAPEFRRTIRAGVRAGRRTLVVSALRSDPHVPHVRIGFVVSRAVGNSVTRNRVKRRLRHLSRPMLENTPVGTCLVVRALPSAANAGAELQQDLTSAWGACLKRLERHT